LQRLFNHGSSEVLNRGRKHNPQRAIPMLKANFFNLLGVEERLEVNNLFTRRFSFYSQSVSADRLAAQGTLLDAMGDRSW